MKSRRGINFQIILVLILLLIGGGRACVSCVSCIIHPRCAKDGCFDAAEEGSRYCQWHNEHLKPYEWDKSKRSESKSYSFDSDDDISERNDNTYKKPKSDKITSPYKDYDAGYDDVYEDGDYDWDRYQKDDDYADGVDDAIEDWDEFGDDW